MQNVLQIEKELLSFYEEVSQVFSSNQIKASLPCLPGCGQCCLNPEVDATIMEMIPMALSLEKQNLAIKYMEFFENQSPKSCMIYEFHSTDGQKGQCSQYSTRPFLCRAFAVAALKDKKGNTSYSVCKLIKEKYPNEYQNLLTTSAKEIAFIHEWSTKLTHIHPEMMNNRLPISEALYLALQKILTLKSYSEEATC